MGPATAVLGQACSLIDDELDAVVALFDEELRSDIPFIEELCSHIRRYRGKMMRPILLLLSARACGGTTREHITLAAVVEMVHMATLVHDDVLDEAEIRRSCRTLSAMTTNETSFFRTEKHFAWFRDSFIEFTEGSGGEEIGKVAITLSRLGDASSPLNVSPVNNSRLVHCGPQ